MSFLTSGLLVAQGNDPQQEPVPAKTQQVPSGQPKTNAAPALGASPATSQQIPAALQGRVQEMRDAGVPEAQIQQILQQAASANAQDPAAEKPDATTEEAATEGDEVSQEAEEQTTEESEAETPPETEAERAQKARELAQKAQQRKNDSIATARNRIFGQDVFTDPKYNFRRADNQVAQPGYIVGAGDEFIIAAWGASELSESLEIQPDGSVSRVDMGKVYIAGLSYQEARRVLITRYQRFLPRGTNLEIIMGPKRRTISINMVGMVPRPGTYEIFATNTAFNAMFEAGGVTELGTVRRILIKRNGQTVQSLDIYKYLLEGNYDPIFLQSNDYVFVPVQGKVVKIEGDIKRPMRYELIEGENLNALIEFAGGLNYHARTNNIQIRRYENGKSVLMDIDLADLITRKEDFQLLDGDLVSIRQSRTLLENVVSVRGSVKYPGNYQLLPGERVSDLIEHAGGLDTVAFLPRAYVIRLIAPGEVTYIPINLARVFEPDQTTHNLTLQYFDKLRVFSRLEFKDEKFIRVSGFVRKPGRFKISPTMTLKDLLYLTGGPREDADLNSIELSAFTYAEDVDTRNIRTDLQEEAGTTGDEQETNEDPDGYEDRVITRIAVNGNWETDPALDTVFLDGFSSVRLYSRYDFIYAQYLQVTGAVKRPGRYQLKRDMTLKDVLYLAGGLQENADVNEVELYQIIDPKDRGHYGTGTSQREIVRVKIDENWRESLVADTLDITTAYKLVVRTEGEFFQQGTVQVLGLVRKPGTFDVLPNMSLRDLFYMTGGINMQADFNHIEIARIIEVEQTNGEIVPIRTSLRTISTSQNWQNDPSLDLVRINAFDQVYVRKNPEFELQETVSVTGEIITEGPYTKKSKNERISSLISRAGGVTELAYLKGASLNRARVGRISIKLDRALRRPGSKWDIPLLEGDVLDIPPRLDIVTIEGNVIAPGTTVLFEPARRKVKYYTNLAGGFDRRTKRKLTTVSYVDGRLKRCKSFLGIKSYPKVDQGSVISVGARPPKPENTDSEGNRIRTRFDMNELMAGVSGVLTFILLIRTATRL